MAGNTPGPRTLRFCSVSGYIYEAIIYEEEQHIHLKPRLRNKESYLIGIKYISTSEVGLYWNRTFDGGNKSI